MLFYTGVKLGPSHYGNKGCGRMREQGFVEETWIEDGRGKEVSG